jgi:hypothetical protein
MTTMMTMTTAMPSVWHGVVPIQNKSAFQYIPELHGQNGCHRSEPGKTSRSVVGIGQH